MVLSLKAEVTLWCSLQSSGSFWVYCCFFVWVWLIWKASNTVVSLRRKGERIIYFFAHRLTLYFEILLYKYRKRTSRTSAFRKRWLKMKEQSSLRQILQRSNYYQHAYQAETGAGLSYLVENFYRCLVNIDWVYLI